MTSATACWSRDMTPTIDPQDEYAPARRLLDGEERYWPEWAFEEGEDGDEDRDF